MSAFFIDTSTGQVATLEQLIERGLAAIIPIAIGFLAKQVGLGSVPDKIAELIGRLREIIDEAIDWLIEQALRLGRAVLDTLMGRAAETPEEAPHETTGAEEDSPAAPSGTTSAGTTSAKAAGDSA